MLLLPLLLCRTFQAQGHTVVILGKWAITPSVAGREGAGSRRDALLSGKRVQGKVVPLRHCWSPWLEAGVRGGGGRQQQQGEGGVVGLHSPVLP